MTDISELTEEQLEKAIPARLRKRLMQRGAARSPIADSARASIFPSGALCMRRLVLLTHLLVIALSISESARAQAPSPVIGAGATSGPILFLSKIPGQAPDGDWELYLADAAIETIDRLTFNSDRTIAWMDVFNHGDGTATLILATKRWGQQFDLLNHVWQPTGNEIINAVNGPMQILQVARLDTTVTPPALTSVSTLIDTEDPNASMGFGRLWHPTFDPNADDSAALEVVFAAALPGETMNLWTMRADGTGLTRLIDQPTRTSNDPSWGVDGWIYYVHSVDPGEPLEIWNSLDVWRIDPIQGTRLRVTNEAAIPGAPRANSDPVLSPDGLTVLALRNDETTWSSMTGQAIDGSAWNAIQAHSDPWRIHGVAHFESATQFLGERWIDCFLFLGCDHQIIRASTTLVDGPVEVLWSSRETGVQVALPVPLPEPSGTWPFLAGALALAVIRSRSRSERTQIQPGSA